MKLAHPLHDRLAAFEIRVDLEGRILCRETLQRQRHFLLITLRLRLNGLLDHGIGEGHRFQNDRVLLIAQRVTRSRVLQTRKCDDVTGKRLINLFAVVGVHHHHAANALGFTFPSHHPA